MRHRGADVRARWLPGARGGAGIATFLFAHAGAGPSAWRGAMDGAAGDGTDGAIAFDLRPVALPGREGRGAEPPVTSLDALVDTVAAMVLPGLDGDFVLVGHSWGAVVATEVATRLTQAFGLTPALLVASCARPPHALTAHQDPISHTADDEFMAALAARTGVPPLGEFAERPEVRAFALPPLRLDLSMAERVVDRAPAVCADHVLVVTGSEDPGVSEADADLWRPYAGEATHTLQLTGGHFCLFEQHARVWSRCRSILQAHLEGEEQ